MKLFGEVEYELDKEQSNQLSNFTRHLKQKKKHYDVDQAIEIERDGKLY